MNRNFVGLVIASCLFLTSSVASAQIVQVEKDKDGVRVKAPGVRIGTDRAVDAKNDLTHALRASNIIGAEVKNGERTALGTVNDLVFNERGQVHYLIMTHGGVLGVGQKYCAVPLRAVTFKPTEDAGEYWIEFNINPKTLEKAPNFTSDKWPNFRDDTFVKSNDKFYSDAVEVNVRTE